MMRPHDLRSRHPALARSAQQAATDDTAVRSEDEVDEGEHAIVCAACLAVITTTRQRIAVQGSHDHRFVNPAGLVFHIGCFAEAVGSTIVGPDSLEYPWFPGFAWRYAMCGGCGTHLGWHFRAERKPSFFGLVLDRLRAPTAFA